MIKADFTSVKRGIASEGTSANTSPPWMSEEELGGDGTNSSMMLQSIVALLTQLNKRNGTNPEHLGNTEITMNTQRVGTQLIMTLGSNIRTVSSGETISASCARYDSGKFSCRPNYKLHDDPSSASAQLDRNLTKAMYGVIGEVDYHIAGNSGSRLRLANNRGELSIVISQVMRISGVGLGYGADYNVKINGQTFKIHCDSSYDRGAGNGTNLPSVENASCRRN